MKPKSLTQLLPIFVLLLILGGLLFILPGSVSAQEPSGDIGSQAAVSSAITYQGRLSDSGGPVNGDCDFRFRLYSAASGGTLLGTDDVINGVPVTDGYFSVFLNDSGEFGANAFSGEARWLEIRVNCGSGNTTLSPRQPLTAAPYAHFALNAPWSGLSGVPSGLNDGDDDTTYTAGTGLTLSGGQFSANTSYLQRRVSSSCATGSAIRVINANGTVTCQTTGGGGAFWSLTGNSGTTPGTHFVGTTDNQALEFKVNNTRALRVEYATDPSYGSSPNLIGGYSSNSVTAGVVGATIGGGGASPAPNQVAGHYGTIGGGYDNTASGAYATVSGGIHNEASNTAATVSGFGNIASGHGATVSGGAFNTASGSEATVSGGVFNTADGDYATVSGGYDNTASGDYSFAAGQQAKANHSGAFVWADSTNADFASDRNNQFKVRASGGVLFEVGGSSGVRGQSSSTSGQGVIGSAIATSGTTYGVVGYSSSPNGYAGYFRNTSSGVALRVQTDSGSGNIIEGWAGFSEPVFRVERDGDVRADGNYYGAGYNSGSADFAEMVQPGQMDLVPGDVLVVGPDGRMVRSSQAYQTSVVGVYSTEPGFLGGHKLDEAGHPLEPEHIPLAVVGIVPVKASTENGPIQPGDLLTSSGTPGHAMRAGKNPPVGTVIGKALEPLTEDSGVIEMLVVLQ